MQLLMSAERISKLFIISFANSASQETNRHALLREKLLRGARSQPESETQDSGWVVKMFVICVTVL